MILITLLAPLIILQFNNRIIYRSQPQPNGEFVADCWTGQRAMRCRQIVAEMSEEQLPFGKWSRADRTKQTIIYNFFGSFSVRFWLIYFECRIYFADPPNNTSSKYHLMCPFCWFSFQAFARWNPFNLCRHNEGALPVATRNGPTSIFGREPPTEEKQESWRLFGESQSLLNGYLLFIVAYGTKLWPRNACAWAKFS